MQFWLTPARKLALRSGARQVAARMCHHLKSTDGENHHSNLLSHSPTSHTSSHRCWADTSPRARSPSSLRLPSPRRLPKCNRANDTFWRPWPHAKTESTSDPTSPPPHNPLWHPCLRSWVLASCTLSPLWVVGREVQCNSTRKLVSLMQHLCRLGAALANITFTSSLADGGGRDDEARGECGWAGWGLPPPRRLGGGGQWSLQAADGRLGPHATVVGPPVLLDPNLPVLWCRGVGN